MHTHIMDSSEWNASMDLISLAAESAGMEGHVSLYWEVCTQVLNEQGDSCSYRPTIELAKRILEGFEVPSLWNVLLFLLAFLW